MTVRRSLAALWAPALIAGAAGGCADGGGKATATATATASAPATATTNAPAGVAAPRPAPATAPHIGRPAVRTASGRWRLRRAPVVVVLGHERAGRLMQVYVRLTRPLDERPGHQALALSVDGAPAGQTATGTGWTDRADGACYANTLHDGGTRLARVPPGGQVTVSVKVGTRANDAQGRTIARAPLRRMLDEQEPGGEADPRWFRALGCRVPRQ